MNYEVDLETLMKEMGLVQERFVGQCPKCKRFLSRQLVEDEGECPRCQQSVSMVKAQMTHCQKCNGLIHKQFVTHSGGNCKKCGTHIAPDWYTWGIENRPWPMPKKLWLPFEGGIRPEAMTIKQTTHFLNVQMGLELPFDLSKHYSCWGGDEYGSPDLDEASVYSLTGFVPYDKLHGALVLICVSGAEAIGKGRGLGLEAAQLLYYVATARAAGSTGRFAQVANEVRTENSPLFVLMDAVTLILHRYGLPETRSVEYGAISNWRRENRIFWSLEPAPLGESWEGKEWW